LAVQKIVGVEVKQGIYEGITYHNVYFHCTTPIEEEKGKGLKVEVIKAKVNMLSEIFGKPSSVGDATNLIGHDVTFYFDAYKNVNFIRDVKEATTQNGFPLSK